jgi:hypothetical protein
VLVIVQVQPVLLPDGSSWSRNTRRLRAATASSTYTARAQPTVTEASSGIVQSTGADAVSTGKGFLRWGTVAIVPLRQLTAARNTLQTDKQSSSSTDSPSKDSTDSGVKSSINPLFNQHLPSGSGWGSGMLYGVFNSSANIPLEAVGSKDANGEWTCRQVLPKDQDMGKRFFPPVSNELLTVVTPAQGRGVNYGVHKRHPHELRRTHDNFC